MKNIATLVQPTLNRCTELSSDELNRVSGGGAGAIAGTAIGGGVGLVRSVSGSAYDRFVRGRDVSLGSAAIDAAGQAALGAGTGAATGFIRGGVVGAIGGTAAGPGGTALGAISGASLAE
jgi:hypothetical protein